MKKNIYIALALLSATVFTSCDDFLDADNKSSVTDEQFFSTKSGLQSLLNDAYESLHDIYGAENYPTLFQCGTDMYEDARTYINDDLHEYETLNPENTVMSSLYQTCYKGIRKAYAVCKYATTAQVDESFRNSATSQARVLAANYYYILVNTFGGVPLMKEYVSSAELGYPKSTAQQVYEYIISELKAVIELNALQASTATNGGGEISLETAEALLAKTYLAAGWDLNNSTYFSDAAAMADKVIANRPLTTSFAALWKGDGSGDDNAEFLWDLEYDQATANNSVSGGSSWHAFYTNYIGGPEDKGKTSTSCFVPTLHVHHAFKRGDVRYAVTFMKELPDLTKYSYWSYFDKESLKGTPVMRYYAAWYETDEDIAAWRAEDPANRADTWILRLDDNTRNPQDYKEGLLTYEQFVTYGYGGAPCRKFDDAKNAMYNTSTDYRDVHIISLSEIYLVAAEAYLKAGKTETALDRINAVHQRAGLDPLSSVNIDNILDERICELFGQGSRWFDLRRTQKLVEYNNLYNPQLMGHAAANIGEKLLRPIPQSAIDANDQLTAADQNPGY